PVGDCRLYPRSSVEPAGHDQRCARRYAWATGAGRRKMIAERVDYSIPADLKNDLSGLRGRALVAGVIGLAATAAGFFVLGPTEFYRSWLWSYFFVLGLTVGPLGWLMLQYTTGGAWGVVIRRPAEAATRTIWLTILLFVPIVIGANN